MDNFTCILWNFASVIGIGIHLFWHKFIFDKVNQYRDTIRVTTVTNCRGIVVSILVSCSGYPVQYYVTCTVDSVVKKPRAQEILLSYSVCCWYYLNRAQLHFAFFPIYHSSVALLLPVKYSITYIVDQENKTEMFNHIFVIDKSNQWRRYYTHRL